ncbi:MAG: FG-GAP-like repeat-containing protein [Bryobacteraceae bacterium]|nr:FG-GAP-like repeat-containing protein [Bryobacteraceae bacterium]
MTRFVLLLATAGIVFSQGISSRGVKPTPRSKPSGLPFHAHFVDIAKEAGLTAPAIYGPVDHKDYIVEVTGAGVALFDYDNDGWLDALVLGGTRRVDAPKESTNRLYRNNRNGTFTNVTRAAGMERTGWASSVAVGDYNNDGFEDVFITYWGRNALYRNTGKGTFEEVSKQAGLVTPGVEWGAGAAWIDYDRDGDLDLFTGTYLEFDFEKVPKPGGNANCNWKGIPVNCGPRGLPTSKSRFYRNNGNGTFTDVSDATGVSKATGSYAMTVTNGDFDNDGWPDLFVACDSTRSFLFRNNRDGTFVEEGLERGAALSEDGMEQAGMGVAAGDYNLDGSIDLFKTHFADDTHGLYRNDGKGFFDDVTLRAGLGVETRYIGWGAGMADFDNDGLPDLFVATGSVYPEVGAKLEQYPFKTPRLVFRNLGNGKFEELIEEAGPGIGAVHSSRGAAFGDFDNDGDVDILVWNMNEPPSLLRNDLKVKTNAWLQVKLVGTKSNRSAIGARVTVKYGGRVQSQDVASQSSYYSSNDRRLHFGLGTATTAEVTVRWPSGVQETIGPVKPNQLLTVREK